jgi:glycosyltransferase involved in cell wall biosynthesis
MNQVAEIGSTRRTPVVSVGIPVYNGERYLRESIDAILAQTFEDFELIVSDNASTDGTAKICEAYVRQDRRVRYLRQPANLGAPRNYSLLVQHARGRYFKWSSASDTCAPSMLQQCVEVLDRDPGVVLCYGGTQLIDSRGLRLEIYDGDFAVCEPTPHERYTSLRRRLGLNNAQNGLIRLEALKQTHLVRAYVASDLAMMTELVLRGKFHLLPEVVLNRRIADDSFSSRLSDAERARFVDPMSGSPHRFDFLRLRVDYIRSIVGAPIPLRGKSRLLLSELRGLKWDLERAVATLKHNRQDSR